ncbi:MULTISPECIES: RNA polymerase sigma factor [Sphingomonadaceae]|uniref:RNA polymerase sigma factor n=1 Tax=Sphingomonadales TaxID=204457 RepID=UPI001314DEF9|nr:sigma-70 family RNA polymerase sigma factor [Sphingobium sp. TKS]MCF8707566.1 sigma-70 family RNA polymerase sigma factor [Rhizorhapis sp. SPR117]
MNGPQDGAAPRLVSEAHGDAIEALFRVEGPRLQRYIRRRLHSGEDVCDLVQEAFVRLAQVAREAMPARPAAYLQRIARNLLIDRSRREIHSAVLRVVQDIAVPATQEDGLRLNDVMQTYEATLAVMPERTRTVFLLYRVEELCYREIAARLGISIPAVQKHMAKALERIALALLDEA